jgi:hypothetical protein
MGQMEDVPGEHLPSVSQDTATSCVVMMCVLALLYLL